MATTEIPAHPIQAQAFERLMQLTTGMVVTAALQPIARLKIPDLLADGPHHVSQLAAETGSNEDALYRVMRLLASVGVFAELPEKVFAITPISQLLRSDVPGSMRDMVLWISNPFHFQVHAELEHSVKTGQPAVEKVCGQTAFEAIFSRSRSCLRLQPGHDLLQPPHRARVTRSLRLLQHRHAHGRCRRPRRSPLRNPHPLSQHERHSLRHPQRNRGSELPHLRAKNGRALPDHPRRFLRRNPRRRRTPTTCSTSCTTGTTRSV